MPGFVFTRITAKCFVGAWSCSSLVACGEPPAVTEQVVRDDRLAPTALSAGTSSPQLGTAAMDESGPASPTLTLRIDTERHSESPHSRSRVILTVDNLDARDGELRISGYVFSDQGFKSFDVVSGERIYGNTSQSWHLDSLDLPLPRPQPGRAGRLSLSAAIKRDDGTRSHVRAPTTNRLEYDGSTREWVFANRLPPTKASNQRGSNEAGHLRKIGQVAEGLRVCFDLVGTYMDSGVGEDLWAEPNGVYPALGVQVKLTEEGTSLYEGPLLADDDNPGCTPTIKRANWGAGVLDVTLRTEAKIGSNTVDLRDYDSETQGSLSARSKFGVDVGEYRWTLDPASTSDDHEWNVFIATIFGVFRNDGGNKGETFNVRSRSGASCASCVSNRVIHIGEWHTYAKFLINHELAHQLMGAATGYRLTGADCSFDSTSCPSVRGSHSMNSKEWIGCALQEGAAHFFAATVYNVADDDDCWFHYYKNDDPNTKAVDCQGENASFVKAYMNSRCNGDHTGYGVELDWMRQMWDVYSRRTDGAPPSLDDMMQWVSTAKRWDRDTAYLELDQAASIVGGTLEANWSTAKGVNGVAH